MYTVTILMPIFPAKGQFYFKGYFYLNGFKSEIYLTKLSFDETILTENEDSQNAIYGHCGDQSFHRSESHKNYIELNFDYSRPIQTFMINGIEVVPGNCIIIVYDFNKVMKSQIITSSLECDNYFSTLHNLIHLDIDGKKLGENNQECVIENKELTSISRWLASSMCIQHILCYLELLKWLKFNISRNKKVQIKEANFIFAIITDLILGYILMNMVVKDKEKHSKILMEILEELVNSLYCLLKWLMGAPAGLKLNNAFNKMLGKFFSYHIQLWWLFLDVSGEKLDVILQVYQFLGYLGLTFQAAMVCDLICIATFHSYCIYVYAARLFNIQISGLTALLRLFVGRKYNPLRGGIDSCEYTNQELFVGTVAFTILLLLLPTTVMYYIVFTLFRLMSLSVQYVLAKIICVIQTMPLYVTILWLVRSPKVAGNIFIEEVSSEGSALILKSTLLTKSLSDLVYIFQPPVMEKPTNWTNNLVSNLLTGKPII